MISLKKESASQGRHCSASFPLYPISFLFFLIISFTGILQGQTLTVPSGAWHDLVNGGVVYEVEENTKGTKDGTNSGDTSVSIDLRNWVMPADIGKSDYISHTQGNLGKAELSGASFKYTPYKNQVGPDQFTFMVNPRALFAPDKNVSYVVNINIKNAGEDSLPYLLTPKEDASDTTIGKSPSNPFVFTLDDDTFDVKEIIEIVDPDLDSDEIQNFVQFDHAFFKLERTNLDTSYNSKSFTQGSGIKYAYKLVWKDVTPPDYDRLTWSEEPTSWDDLNITYSDAVNPSKTIHLKVELKQVWEKIEYLSNPILESKITTLEDGEKNMSDFFAIESDHEARTYTVKVTEDDDLALKFPIKVNSPDGQYYQLFYDWKDYTEVPDDENKPELPFNVAFLNQSLNENTPTRFPSTTATFNSTTPGDYLSAAWESEDSGQMVVDFKEDDFCTNDNEPIILDLYAVPGLVGESDPGTRNAITKLATFEIHVEDDLSDPIQFDLDFKDSTNPYRLTVPENQTNSWSFDFSDPDLKISRGKEGALITASLDPNSQKEGIFSLDVVPDQSNGAGTVTLTLEKGLDYEDLKATRNDPGYVFHIFPLKIQDSSNGVSIGTQDNLFIRIEVTDKNDAPYIPQKSPIFDNDVQVVLSSINNSDYDYNVSTYEIDENTEWKFSDNLRDLVRAEDVDAAQNISWSVYNYLRRVPFFAQTEKKMESINLIRAYCQILRILL